MKIFNKDIIQTFREVKKVSPWGVGPSILMYHSISDNSKEPYSVSTASFGEQVSWMVEHGFEIISLSSLCRSIQMDQYNNLTKKVVITFDDGYRDFLTNALPVLRGAGAHATVFIVTDMLGEKSTWNELAPHERLMSEDEVRYIKAQGVSLGSHTTTHVDLSKLSPEKIHSQLQSSFEMLSTLGESFCTLSYPFGQWSRPVMEAVNASGYECALTVGEYTRLTVGNIFLLPRITMTRDMDLVQFHKIMQRRCIMKELLRGYRHLRTSFLGSQNKNI